MASCTFPGEGEKQVTTLSDAMPLPNYLFYVGEEDSKEIGFELNNITEKDGTISFDFAKSVPTAIKAISTVAEKTDGACYDLQGRRVASPTKGLYIHNGRKIVVK